VLKSAAMLLFTSRLVNTKCRILLLILWLVLRRSELLLLSSNSSNIIYQKEKLRKKERLRLLKKYYNRQSRIPVPQIDQYCSSNIYFSFDFYDKINYNLLRLVTFGYPFLNHSFINWGGQNIFSKPFFHWGWAEYIL
jgi:hypothetical protein